MTNSSTGSRTAKRTSLFYLGVIYLIFLVITPQTVFGSVMNIPSGRQVFNYDAMISPVFSSDPAEARPVGVSKEGNALAVRLGLAQFSGPVDIFFGVYSPAVDQEIHVLRPDRSFQPLSHGLIAWKTERTGAVDEDLFGMIKIAELPPGRYTFYVAVTPSDSKDEFIVWETSYELSQSAVISALASLKSADSCDDLLDSLKERAIREMEKTMDQLIENVRLYGWSCFAEIAGFSPPAAPADSGASQYSETNVQVAGVDEADFVKNDGSYIYILADNRFQIIDAWPPQESRVISSSAVEGIPKKLFVAADRAMVYSSLAPLAVPGPYGSINSPWLGYGGYYYDVPQCTYGYDCDFTGDGRDMKITIYDISDRSDPKLRREIVLNGSYINSRRIGTTVHTVALFPPPLFPGVAYWPALMEQCWLTPDLPAKDDLLEELEDLKTANRLAIEGADITEVLPSLKDTKYVNGTAISESSLVQSCTDVYLSDRPEGQSFLSLLSLSIDSDEEVQGSTILGRPGAVYATPSSLYVAARQQYYPDMGWFFPVVYEEPTEATAIHKFSLGAKLADTRYVGSAVVKGRVLNQFSMDEHDGYFRITTTSGHSPAPDAHSTVSILGEQNGEISMVGQVDNIAPSEDIRSVRFFGDRGFLVTFKKTDPLFALDLSKPSEPRVSGELKIPGFSTYMQFIDDSHLLTIGYDAEDMGGFAWFQGILLQIFDVSDMSAPSLMHKEVIGTRGTTSDAATNHLAFNYFSPKDLLAIPATICEGGSGGFNGTTMTFSGLLVYDVSTETGIKKRGGVSHVDPLSDESYNLCYNWWTQPNSVVKRSIFMDDYVYSVALDKIKVDSLDDLGHDLTVIDLKRE